MQGKNAGCRREAGVFVQSPYPDFKHGARGSRRSIASDEIALPLELEEEGAAAARTPRGMSVAALDIPRRAV